MSCLWISENGIVPIGLRSHQAHTVLPGQCGEFTLNCGKDLKIEYHNPNSQPAIRWEFPKNAAGLRFSETVKKCKVIATVASISNPFVVEQ